METVNPLYVSDLQEVGIEKHYPEAFEKLPEESRVNDLQVSADEQAALRKVIRDRLHTVLIQLATLGETTLVLEDVDLPTMRHLMHRVQKVRILGGLTINEDNQVYAVFEKLMEGRLP